MALAATLSQRFPDIGLMERQRFRAVLLDEFQDTSEAQLVLLRHLFVADGQLVPVTAVGDPNQSIYGWRGASATTLTRFPREFADGSGDAQVLPLSTSWRNDNAILVAANITSGPLRSKSRVDVEVLRPRPGAGTGAGPEHLHGNPRLGPQRTRGDVGRHQDGVVGAPARGRRQNRRIAGTGCKLTGGAGQRRGTRPAPTVD